MTDQSPSDDEQVTTVTCRYWAAARAAAGVESESVQARTLAELLDVLAERHRDRDRFAEVIESCSVLVGEIPVGAREPATVRLMEGDSVEFLPPFAGG